MESYLKEQIEKISRIYEFTYKYEESIKYSIENLNKSNISEFFDYYYKENQEFHDLYEALVFFSYKGEFINKSNIKKDSIIVQNKIEKFVDKIFNRKDFYAFFKTLTVSNKKEKDLKNKFLTFFDTVSLDKDKQESVLELMMKLEEKQSLYVDNVYNLDFIYESRISKEILETLDSKEIDLYLEKDKTAYYFKNNKNVLLEALKNSGSEFLRKKAYSLICNVGVDNNEEKNNLQLATDIISIEREHANLLGFKNHLAYAIKDNLISKKENVFSLLEYNKAMNYDQSVKDFEILREYIKDNFDVDNIKHEDLFYYVTKYKLSLRDYKNEIFQSFYDPETILNKCLEKYEELFEIRFEEIEEIDMTRIDYGHRYYNVYYKNVFKAKLIIDGEDYDYKCIDPSVSTIRSITKNNGGFYYLNLSPINKIHSPDQVIDYSAEIMHELGHVVEFVLNEPEYLFDGLYDIFEKDVCEIFSSTMELFSEDKDFLIELSSHSTTNEKINIKYWDDFFKSYYFFESYLSLYDGVFAMFDAKIHSEKNAEYKFLKIKEEIINEYICYYDEMQNELIYDFIHSFDSSYSGNYYSYVLGKYFAKILYEDVMKNEKRRKAFKHKVLKHCENNDFYNSLLDFYEGEFPKKLSFLVKNND